MNAIEVVDVVFDIFVEEYFVVYLQRCTREINVYIKPFSFLCDNLFIAVRYHGPLILLCTL